MKLSLAFNGNDRTYEIDYDVNTLAALKRCQQRTGFSQQQTATDALWLYNHFIISQAKGLDFGVFGNGVEGTRRIKLDGFDEYFSRDVSDWQKATFLTEHAACVDSFEHFKNMLGYTGIGAKELLARAVYIWERCIELGEQQHCYLGGDIHDSGKFGTQSFALFEGLFPDPAFLSFKSRLDMSADPEL